MKTLANLKFWLIACNYFFSARWLYTSAMVPLSVGTMNGPTEFLVQRTIRKDFAEIWLWQLLNIDKFVLFQ